MKKIIASIMIAVALIVGCTDDKKKLMKEDFDRSGQELRITVHTHKNQKALLKATAKYNSTYEVGMAIWNNVDNVCEIHVIAAKHQNDKEFETWGHELAHCVYGTFH